ncbi:unnamed protein product [Fusarium venenatum]|uniref:Zn(2)-C6 fungal-type domain-containing protein n=1 Tax=Fusarium venenatum TaxID=56646 RepID=A0A2L2TDI1_9HYPO|nr:uncharacterized protein FVRRES_08225 [Fusarium venenatum]CEI68148.1 unnamed protein product [Fusarium venenatum]
METSRQPQSRPKRKPHKKSRTGCLDCRKRRVKCNEERPRCWSCKRRDIDCEYPDKTSVPVVIMPPLPVSPMSPLVVSQSPSITSVLTPTPTLSSTTDSLHNLDYTPTGTLELTQLRLLHHWTLSTSVDLCKCPKTLWIWQEAFPQMGFQHPFVLNALLGLAALHIAYQSPLERKKRWLDGMYHHGEALIGFQRQISNITADNSEALFTWSICNVLYVFAMSNPLLEPVDGVSRLSTSTRNERVLGAEWIPMIRGIDAVLEPTHNYIRFGKMKNIMSLGNWYELDPGKDSNSPEDDYFCNVRDTWSSSASSEVYEEALHILRKCRLYSQQFRNMDSKTRGNWGYNKEWSGPLIFIHFAPESYFTLLKQRQPPALILFALFGVLLHGIDGYWFMQGWGKAIVEVVADILGGFWKQWLLWPLQVVQNDGYR